MRFSIIIPAYNVEHYIDACIKSVLEQSFGDFEILLINDGSTDQTGSKCEYWRNKDSRIRYMSQENIGLGRTREKGIHLAKGEFLLFLDSDDWYQSDALESLEQSIRTEASDILVYDYYNVWANGDKELVKCPLYLKQNTSVKERPDLLYRIEPSMCMNLFRTKFLQQCNIHSYQGKMEDLSVSNAYLLMAQSIGQLRKPIYNYRRNRPDSITTKKSILKECLPSLMTLEQNMVGIKDIPRRELIYFYQYFLFGTLKAYETKFCFENAEYQNLWRQAEQFISQRDDKNYTSFFHKKVVLWGSYSLRKMWNSVDFLLDSMSLHITASSILSAESTPVSAKLKGNNSYRRNAVEIDFKKNYFSLMKEIRPDYLIVDLLEERDGIRGSIHHCVTNSEYMNECCDFREIEEEFQKGCVTPIQSEVYLDLFHKACKQWAEKITKIVKPEKIILVWNLLSEEEGSYQKERNYPQEQQIKEDNHRLNCLYQCLMECIPKMQVIYPSEELKYTDSSYLYGVRPYHYNSYLLCEVGETLRSIMEKED